MHACRLVGNPTNYDFAYKEHNIIILLESYGEDRCITGNSSITSAGCIEYFLVRLVQVGVGDDYVC